MYVEGDKSVLGAEVLYVVLGIVLLVLMAGIVAERGEENETRAFWHGRAR